ncbi:MAG TPA: sigma factor [Streptosporangiaceae bacterium]|nr:sigma factor [Streptosporangiaceae bacterium]
MAANTGYPDAALWQAAAAGEHAAFGQLFDRHATAVYNYLYRRTADWSAAEDLTAAVFLQAWRRRTPQHGSRSWVDRLSRTG